MLHVIESRRGSPSPSVALYIREQSTLIGDVMTMFLFLLLVCLGAGLRFPMYYMYIFVFDNSSVRPIVLKLPRIHIHMFANTWSSVYVLPFVSIIVCVCVFVGVCVCVTGMTAMVPFQRASVLQRGIHLWGLLCWEEQPRSAAERALCASARVCAHSLPPSSDSVTGSLAY